MNHSISTFRLIRVAPEQFKDVDTLSYFRELALSIKRKSSNEQLLERHFSDRTEKLNKLLGRGKFDKKKQNRNYKFSVSKHRGKGSTSKNWMRVARSYGILYSPSGSSAYSLGTEGKILNFLTKPQEEEIKENPKKLSVEERIFFLYLMLKKDGDHFLALLKSIKEARDLTELQGEFNDSKYKKYPEGALRNMWGKKGSDVVTKWGTFQRNIIAIYALHTIEYGMRHRKWSEYLKNISDTPCWKGKGTRIHRTVGRMGFAEDLGLKKKNKLKLTNEGEKLLNVVEKSLIKRGGDINREIVTILKKNRVFIDSEFEILDKELDYYLFNLSDEYLEKNVFSIIQDIYFDKPKIPFNYSDFLKNLDESFGFFSHSLLQKMNTDYLPYYSVKTLAKNEQTVAEFHDIVSFLKTRKDLSKFNYNFEWSSKKITGWIYRT